MEQRRARRLELKFGRPDVPPGLNNFLKFTPDPRQPPPIRHCIGRLPTYPRMEWILVSCIVCIVLSPRSSPRPPSSNIRITFFSMSCFVLTRSCPPPLLLFLCFTYQMFSLHVLLVASSAFHPHQIFTSLFFVMFWFVFTRSTHALLFSTSFLYQMSRPHIKSICNRLPFVSYECRFLILKSENSRFFIINTNVLILFLFSSNKSYKSSQNSSYTSVYV